MKIRMGFVSNSSSSSFLVPVDQLDHEKEQKLQDFGFVKVETSNPFELYFVGEEELKNKNGCSYAYDVSCNEDEIAYFLTRELNVSFMAAVHYAHWFWTYEATSQIINCYYNLGLATEMYGELDRFFDISKNHYTIPISTLEKVDYEI